MSALECPLPGEPIPFSLGTEMVLNYNLTLSNDTIAMYVSFFARVMFILTNLVRVWISSADAAAVAEKGLRFVHAASNSFYLVRPPSHYHTSLLSLALNVINRIAAPVPGWVISRRAIAGASPSRLGRMYVPSFHTRGTAS
jgi:hypothetical protein